MSRIFGIGRFGNVNPDVSNVMFKGLLQIPFDISFYNLSKCDRMQFCHMQVPLKEHWDSVYKLDGLPIHQ